MKHRTRKEEIFEEIFRAYEVEIYKVCLYYTRDTLASRELTQNTLFNLYVHFEEVDPECVRAYAFRTARNLSFNWVRDNKIAHNGRLHDLTEDCALLISVEEAYIREEQKRVAQELSESILSGLYAQNKLWYEMIIMAYFFNRPQGEIAEELGVSRYVVSSRLYRAKQWIRENYSEQYEKCKEILEG